MCMADYSDGEPAEFYNQIIILQARKDHECTECRRKIGVGESYERVCAKWDGSVQTVKTCAHCIAARSWLEIVCGGWLHGSIQDDLREHWFEEVGYHTMWLGRAIVGMRRKWKDLKPLPDFRSAKAPS